MDPIADMLTRIRNGLRAKFETVDVPHSKIKSELARVFLDEGFITKCEVLERGTKKILRITLKYGKNKLPVISALKRISKLGRRVYVKGKEIRRIQAGFGTSILSTSKGIMTDTQARRLKVGGEVLCQVW